MLIHQGTITSVFYNKEITIEEFNNFFFIINQYTVIKTLLLHKNTTYNLQRFIVRFKV